MGFTKLPDLNCENTYALGGKDKTGKANPKQVEGYYLGAREVESKKSKTGFASLHVFQTAKGNVGIWGKTNLDMQLKNVTPGTMTRATFTGMVETKNNPMYKYSIEVDKDNTIEVAANNDSSEESYEESNDSEEQFQSEEPEETNDEEAPLDEEPPVQVARSTAPVRSNASKSKVEALLGKRRSA